LSFLKSDKEVNPNGSGYFEQIGKSQNQHQDKQGDHKFPVDIKYQYQYSCEEQTEECGKNIGNEHGPIIKSGFSDE
jgi:hypothetical protein